MAAEDFDLNDATEPREDEAPELDQPEDRSYVSLDQLLDGADGEVSEEGEQDSGVAARSAEKPPEGFRTQADFDKAFGQRVAGLRKQWEREHAEELAIAETVRRRYQGKSAAEVQEAMILEEARELMVETGWSEEEAVKKVRARINFDRRAGAADDIDPETLERVAGQLQDFSDRFGIDLEAEIEKDQGLLKFIGKDGDLSRVMLEVGARRGLLAGKLGTKQDKPNRPAVPTPERHGAARSASVARKLTDSDIARIDAAAQRGIHVRLD
jgi:hypothetical protein